MDSFKQKIGLFYSQPKNHCPLGWSLIITKSVLLWCLNVWENEHAGPNARSRYDTRGFRTLWFDINGGSPGRHGDQRCPCSALLGRYHLEMILSHIIIVKKKQVQLHERVLVDTLHIFGTAVQMLTLSLDEPKKQWILHFLGPKPQR